jgi:hypothetical protein
MRIPNALMQTRSGSTARGALLIALLATFASGALSASASAAPVTPGTGWQAFSSVFPTNLPPGGTGKIQLDIMNTGSLPSSGAITVTDTLPPGLTATAAGGMPTNETAGTNIYTEAEEVAEFGEPRWKCSGNGPGGKPAGATSVTCVSNPAVLPSLPRGSGSMLTAEFVERLGVAVNVAEGATGRPSNEITLSGGGAARTTTVSDPLTISSSPPGAGFAGWDVWMTNADGSPATQAGSHPYEATLALGFNELADGKRAGGEPRNLQVDLPPGFFGDPGAVPRCTRLQFDGLQCPPQSQVGTDAPGLTFAFNSITGTGLFEHGLGVYNVVPPPGIAAELGFTIARLRLLVDVGVRNGGGYGLVAHANNISESTAAENIITLWGVPADPSHDRQRVGCGEEVESCASGLIAKPFLTLPTSCAGPQPFTIHGQGTWTNPGETAEATVLTHDDAGVPTGFTGCEKLSMAPSLSAVPETALADSPTGLNVDLKLPQETLTEPHGLVAATIKNTRVTLPQGLVINPGQAAGLVACQEAQANVHGEGPSSCPLASKVGTMKIKTPLLEGTEESELEGDVYVLQSNPPNLQLLFTASADGISEAPRQRALE